MTSVLRRPENAALVIDLAGDVFAARYPLDLQCPHRRHWPPILEPLIDGRTRNLEHTGSSRYTTQMLDGATQIFDAVAVFHGHTFSMLHAGVSTMLRTSAPTMLHMSTFAERFREAREGAGISQSEIARRLGVDRGLIWQWENGKVKNPQLEHVWRAADELRVNPRWLHIGQGRKEGLSRDALELAEFISALPEGRRQAARALLDPSDESANGSRARGAG